MIMVHWLLHWGWPLSAFRFLIVLQLQDQFQYLTLFLVFQAYQMRNAGAVIHSHGIESCIATMINPSSKEFRVSFHLMASITRMSVLCVQFCKFFLPTFLFFCIQYMSIFLQFWLYFWSGWRLYSNELPFVWNNF